MAAFAVYSGAAWVAKPVKVWNGTSWALTVVKVWNGSAWQTVSSTGQGEG